MRSFVVIRCVVTVSVVVVSAVGVAACGSGSRAQQHSAPGAAALVATGVDVTRQGRLLMEFEALLLKTFHTSNVSASGQANFSCTHDCSPLSKYRLYKFTFSHPVGSVLKLGPHALGNVTFGNYPYPVRIKGRYVACAPGKYLILYASAVSFALDCLPPEKP